MICNDHLCVPDCENNIASIFSCKDFSENSFYIQSSFRNECRRNIFPIKTETPPQNLFWSLWEPVVKPWMLKKNFKKLYGPFFLWMGFNCLKATATSRRQFTFYHWVPRYSGTHFINLGRRKGWVDLGATQWFWTWNPSIGNPAP